MDALAAARRAMAGPSVNEGRLLLCKLSLMDALSRATEKIASRNKCQEVRHPRKGILSSRHQRICPAWLEEDGIIA